MLELIIGKAKTGKSKYIFDEIDEAVKNNYNVIFFVPSQMRMLSEEKYLKYQNKDGIININFTTISDFVLDYIEKNNLHKLNKEYLSNIDKKIIINKIISENQEIFSFFNKCKNTPGFADNMQIYMDLFKKNEINKQKFESINSNEDILLYSKFSEIYKLYEKYQESEELKKYVDSIDEIELFLKNYNAFKIEKEYIQKTKIFFDSYNNFTKSELKFIERLMKLGLDIKISVSSNILEYLDDVEDILDINKISNILSSEENKLDMFYPYNLTVLNLVKQAKLNSVDTKITSFFNNPNKETKKDIVYLMNNIFTMHNEDKIQSDNINIKFTTNMYTEITNVAKDIIQKIQKGSRYKDFALYTSNIDEYAEIIRNIFIEYNIPVHIDKKIKVVENVIYKYIHNILLMTVDSIRYEILFNTLKLNLLNISKDDISYFENYCLEFNICNEYLLKRDIVCDEKSNYDENRLTEIKRKTVDIFLNLKNNLQKCNNAQEIVKIIYNHLVENNILNNFEILTKKLHDSEDIELKYIASTNIVIWENICDILDSIAKIYDKNKITIRNFLEIFRRVSLDITKKCVPSAIDEVEILDIDVSKTLEKKHIYFLGVNEGKFPRSIKDDLFFSDKDLQNLKEKYDITIKEDSISKTEMQNYNIYEAISSATNTIDFYFIASDITGNSLRPSSLITTIKQLLDIKIKNTDQENMNKIYSIRSLLQELEIKLEKNEIDEKLMAIYNYLINNERYKNIITYIRESNNLSDKTLNLIYDSNEINSSISKLEQFKKCPFSYFVKYNLKIDERKEYKITSLDLGSFMHGVLEKFSRYLWDKNINWHEILLDEECYFKILDQIIDNEFNKSLFKYKDNVKYNILRKKLINAMRHAIITIAKSFNQSDFKPIAYELEFADHSKFKPIEIKLSETKTMKLIGKIDRVDIATIDDVIYARIVDYKSSSKDLSLDDVREGISLQLMTYISAYTQSTKNVRPAGVMYFNLSDKIAKFGDYINDEEKISAKITETLRMKGIFLSDVKVLEIMDKKIDTQDRLINVSMRTVKSGKTSKNLIDEENFKNVCIEIKDILRDIGRDLIIRW